MTSSLLGLILSALSVVVIFLGFGDRVRGRRERAQARENSKIQAAVEAAVKTQRDADADVHRTAVDANEALKQQLVERTNDMRAAQADRDFYRGIAFNLLAERGQLPPKPPSETP